MLNTYTVTMESKDNNIFSYNTIATNKRQAGLQALTRVEEKSWGRHEYVIINIAFLGEPENTMSISAKSDIIGILKGGDSE